MICVLGPKGGTGKTLTSSNLGRRARADRQARRTRSTSTSSSATSRCASALRPRRRSTTSPPRPARSTPRSSRRTSSRTTSRACGCSSRRRGPTRRASITVEFLRELYALLRETHRLRRRRHAARASRAEVIATIDASSRRSAWSSMLDTLSLKNTQARARDARADGLRARPHHARPQPGATAGSASADDDVERDRSGGSPTSSSRATARSRARSTRAGRSCWRRPESEAAQAFATLADDVHRARPRRRPRQPRASRQPQPRRRLLAEEDLVVDLHERLHHATRRADDPAATTRSPSSRTACTSP